MLCITVLANAQQANSEAFALGAGGTFGKSKIPKDLTKLGIAEFRVKFYNVITKTNTARETSRGLFGKTQGAAVTGKVTSYLEITDGDLADADFLEITNHGYYYFNKKLKENNIDTVAWSAIEATEFYADNAKEKDDKDNDEDQSNGNVATAYNAFDGNTLYGGRTTAFAMKYKKLSRTCEAAGAPLMYVNIAIEFADIEVEVSAKKQGGYKSTWTPTTVQNTTFLNSKTKVVPLVKVTNNIKSNVSYLTNDNNKLETISLTQDIWSEQNFATNVFEDEARAEKKKNKLFSVSFSKKLVSTPVVIETTKELYKTAAKKALERYADGLIAKFLEMKNS